MRFITPDTNNRFSCLVYGQPGVGKTSLLRTIPDGEPVCTLSAESGLLSVRDMVMEGRITGVEIDSFDDFEEAYAHLAENDHWRKACRWIFIDSLTEIASRCVEKFIIKFPDKKDSYNLWGEYVQAMTRLIKGFRDLTSYNVVFTALVSVDLDEVKRRFFSPDMPGQKLKERLPAWFDEVFHMDVVPDGDGGRKRVFYTGPHDNYPAKDRSGRLDYVEGPNLADIEAKILR